MRNDTFCFMPYFQLYETILFLLLIHLGFKNVCNLVLYPIVKRRHADFKKFGIYRCPQPNYDSFGGKCFQDTFKFKYPSTQLTSSVQMILR